MNYIFEGFKEAIGMLVPPGAEILKVVWLSFIISGISAAAAFFIGIPAAFAIASKEFSGKKAIVGLLNTWMAMPAVVIGLLVYSFVSRSGPLGVLGLLFTPGAMIIAQTLLALPIIVSLAVTALTPAVKEVKETALSIGASSFQAFMLIIRESGFALTTAFAAAFARVIGETGMTLMVGGNIKGYTRVMTTTIALETMKGNFATGLALGIVLLIAALAINLFLQYLNAHKN